jgi:hypothetical protein
VSVPLKSRTEFGYTYTYSITYEFNADCTSLLTTYYNGFLSVTYRFRTPISPVDKTTLIIAEQVPVDSTADYPQTAGGSALPAITDYSSAPYPLPFTSAFDRRVYVVPDDQNIYYNPYVAKLIHTVPNYNDGNVYSYWTTGTDTKDVKMYGSQSCNSQRDDIVVAMVENPSYIYLTFVTMTAISRTVHQLGAGGLPATTSNYSYKMYFPPENTLYGSQLDVYIGCLAVTSLPKLTTEQSFIDAFYLVCDGTC